MKRTKSEETMYICACDGISVDFDENQMEGMGVDVRNRMETKQTNDEKGGRNKPPTR